MVSHSSNAEYQWNRKKTLINQILKGSQILTIRVRIPRLLSRLLSVVEINVDIVAATSVIPSPVGAAL